MCTVGLLHTTRAKLFSADRTLTGSSGSRSWTRGRRPARRTVGAGVVRKMLAIFISPITSLLGNAGNHHRGELSFAALSPNLFHRWHFDWWLGILLSTSCPSPKRPAPERSAPTFPYQSHFDWQPGFRPPTRDRAPPPSEPSQRTRGPIAALSRIHRKPTALRCTAPLATLHQVFLTDHTLTGRTILHLFSGAIVGLMSNTIIVFAAGFDTKEV